MTESRSTFGLVRMVPCFSFLELHATDILYQTTVFSTRMTMKLFMLPSLLILYDRVAIFLSGRTQLRLRIAP